MTHWHTVPHTWSSHYRKWANFFISIYSSSWIYLLPHSFFLLPDIVPFLTKLPSNPVNIYDPTYLISSCIWLRFCSFCRSQCLLYYKSPVPSTNSESESWQEIIQLPFFPSLAFLAEFLWLLLWNYRLLVYVTFYILHYTNYLVFWLLFFVTCENEGYLAYVFTWLVSNQVAGKFLELSVEKDSVIFIGQL